jgi:hypothetical protein
MLFEDAWGESVKARREARVARAAAGRSIDVLRATAAAA